MFIDGPSPQTYPVEYTDNQVFMYLMYYVLYWIDEIQNSIHIQRLHWSESLSSFLLLSFPNLDGIFCHNWLPNCETVVTDRPHYSIILLLLLHWLPKPNIWVATVKADVFKPAGDAWNNIASNTVCLIFNRCKYWRLNSSRFLLLMYPKSLLDHFGLQNIQDRPGMLHIKD